ncbi:ubiquinone biosynthesis regulatory protein kinase UbiB [Zymobacter sp. IVIA_12111.31 C1]|uniref:ubiquinone biosynthesis regulatory protein kinase UbiB n=1 Tax=Zymobacter sp. IVIA_12111.31 C1 TaxID=3394854 RepID=UPI0039C46B23
MLTRLLRIFWVIARYRLDLLLPRHRLPTRMRLLLLVLPFWLFPKRDLPRAVRLRVALETLGPIYVKFGQMLSTRRDLLPSDFATELKKLQDQVPPFPNDVARRVVEESLGAPIDRLFSHFEASPLASASIAQVHAARLPEGDDVVVKIIRPGIDKVLRSDMLLLTRVARLLRCVPEFRRLRPVEVVEDYRLSLFDELDLHKEAANTSQLRRNFSQSHLLYVPTLYWPLTRRNVMVQERIYGIPVADIETLRAKGVDLRLLAERGVEIFFTQVFRDNFFHADMHPGNIFVDARDPADPRYIAIDCGIVGSLTREDQDYLARNILAFFHQDYYEVAALHIESGWVGEGTRANEFASAIRAVCEPIFEKPLKDISFGQALMGLFQTAQRFNMEVQPQLILLQKTLINIEGLGRTLYPELDLWHTAKPYLENWMRERSGPRGLWKSLKRHAPELTDRLPELPLLAHQALRTYAHGQRHRQQLAVAQSQQLRQSRHQPRRYRRLRIGLLLLATALAWQPFLSDWVAEQHWSTLTAGAVGLLLLLL